MSLTCEDHEFDDAVDGSSERRYSGTMTQDTFSLKGKTAVVTGAAGFFGGYFVRGLLDAGARVVAIDHSPEKLAQLRENTVAEYGERSLATVATDQYDQAGTEDVFKKILEEEGRVDVLVNNAFDFSKRTGFNTPAGKLEHATYKQIEKTFQAGVYWAIQATQLFGKVMKEQGKGSIVNICSMYGVVVPSPKLYEGTEKFNPPGYSMAKAGLLQFTRYAASFLGPEVRVNAISPGAFPNLESKSHNAVSANEEGDFLKRLSDRTLLGRTGHPRELVGGLIYLASDASSYVTGHNLVIDGGWTVT